MATPFRRSRTNATAYSARRLPAAARFREERRALTASAGSTLAADADGKTIPQHQPWQVLAFRYYDLLGECRGPAQFLYRALSRVRFYAATLDDSGERVEIDDTSNPAVALVNAVAPLAPEYGRLSHLIGEGRLCQSRPKNAAPDSAVVWEYLAPTEIALRDSGRKIVRVTGIGKEEYENIGEVAGDEPEPGQMRMWRFWRPHPRNSGLPDSPVRGVLDLYEQLWWVTMGERSDLQSRVADRGILTMPKELSLGQPIAPDAPGDDPESDAFMVEMGDAIMEAIEDPGSAAAAGPIVLRGPKDLLHPDMIRLIRLRDGDKPLIVSDREAALIERIAYGLEMPVEALVGMSRANHWTAWKVEDEKWEYVEPVVKEFVEHVESLFLAPILAASGVDGNVVVGYDASAFARDPDRGKTALALHKEGLLSAEATVVANGFGEEDLMPDDEKQEWLAVQLRSPEMLGVTSGDAGGGAAPTEDPVVDEEQAPVEDDSTGRPSETAARAVAFAVKHARGAVGARLRASKRSAPDVFTDDLLRVPNHALPARLGWKSLSRLGLTEVAAVTLAAEAMRITLDEIGYTIDEDAAVAYFAENLWTDTPPTETLTAAARLA